MFHELKRNLLVIVSVVVVIVGAVSLRPSVDADRAGPCVVHRTSLPEISEASGLAVSRRNPGVLWSHNDSGNATVLFALDERGGLRGRVRVPVRTRDWEDISAARCPAGDCLYIADLGDNGLARKRIEIYQVPEPTPGDTETAQPVVFTAAYADGPHNAEALFVLGSDVFVITRDRTGGLYRSTLNRREITLERIGQLGLAAVSDAEASPDQTSVVVRTPKSVVTYRATDIIRGGMVRHEKRISVESLKEPQGEGVALDAAGILYLASEGRPWNRAGRFISLRCSTP